MLRKRDNSYVIDVRQKRTSSECVRPDAGPIGDPSRFQIRTQVVRRTFVNTGSRRTVTGISGSCRNFGSDPHAGVHPGP